MHKKVKFFLMHHYIQFFLSICSILFFQKKALYSRGMILNGFKLLQDGSKLPETHWQRLYELLKKTITIFICQK